MVGLIDKKEQPEDIKDALVRYIKYKNGKADSSLELDLFNLKFSKEIDVYNRRNWYQRRHSFCEFQRAKVAERFERILEVTEEEEQQFEKLAAE